MEYVVVFGSPSSLNERSDIIFNYFNNYLISIAEATQSKNWSLFQINKNVKKMLQFKKTEIKKYNKKIELYLDSGGFQIIVGYIKPNRIREYTDVYHFILKKYYKDIDYIFSLDITNKSWDRKTTIEYNDYSIDQSIQLIKNIPEIADKQLFIVQTRTTYIFDLWKELMDKHQVYKYYKKYSFGGLVGLKKETNAKFTHVVPFIFWLLLKIKQNNGTIEHLHLLGQSSRLIIFTAILIERLLEEKENLKIKLTMDSSELIRFSPIDQKLPLFAKTIENEKKKYFYIRNLDDIEHMLLEHSSKKHLKTEDNDKYLNELEKIKRGKIDNEDFIEFLSQNINNTKEFTNEFIDEKGIDNILKMDVDDLKNSHEFFTQGRLSTEIKNNIDLINEFYQYYKNNDINNAEKRCFEILKTY